ncbi:MAG: hypothetical protein AB8G17_02025 [Gammaproteobacteria bacterium]
MIRSIVTALGVLLLVGCQPEALTCAEQLTALGERDFSSLEQREYDGPQDESTEGASIIHHYDAAQTLHRVTVAYYGEMGRREIDYRLVDTDTFSMVVTDVAYARPISPSEPTQGGESTIASYQMCDGAVIARPDPPIANDDRDHYLERLSAFMAPTSQER